MTARNIGPRQKPTSADVLLANQLYYALEAKEYDHKNHVRNPVCFATTPLKGLSGSH